MELVSMLLESKAKVDHRSKNGLTAMHLAAQEDRVPVAEVLAKHQADVDPQTKVSRDIDAFVHISTPSSPPTREHLQKCVGPRVRNGR